ncbi:ASCH domain-containing protein [Herbiconiux sp. 11R-BC]|uniref:ASCH domain-containing protein n=1 Tax=Herbiconiux sp. 11R-BC TaxID=3111637 RepID=UPI003BFE3D84
MVFLAIQLAVALGILGALSALTASAVGAALVSTDAWPASSPRDPRPHDEKRAATAALCLDGLMWPRHDGYRAMELGTPGAWREELNALVLMGVKRSTMGQAAEYASEGEGLEHLGERLALLDSTGGLAGWLTVTRVDTLRFGDLAGAVGDAVAASAGEGFRDAAHLREGYARHWAGTGTPASDDTVVHVIWFTAEPA